MLMAGTGTRCNRRASKHAGQLDAVSRSVGRVRAHVGLREPLTMIDGTKSTHPSPPSPRSPAGYQPTLSTRTVTCSTSTSQDQGCSPRGEHTTAMSDYAHKPKGGLKFKGEGEK